jgi:hypothetical protein
MNARYVAGFFDGEGTVTAGYQHRCNNKGIPEMRLQIGICQSYLSGLFDAEGYIGSKVSVVRHKHNVRSVGLEPGITIEDDNDDVLNIISGYLRRRGIKCGIHTPRKLRGANRLLRTITITGYYNVVKFLEMIQPYSIVKRKQIELCLTHILPLTKPTDKVAMMRRNLKGHTKYTKPQFLKIMRWIDKLAAMKGKGQSNRKYSEAYFKKKWRV